MNRFLSLGFVLMLAGCGSSGDGGDEETSDVPKIDCTAAMATGIPTYSQLTFLHDVCVNCHDSTKTTSEARQAANPDVNYDTYEAAKASATKGVSEVYEGGTGAMPPEGSQIRHLTDPERVQFNTWAQCGTPQ